MKRIAIALAGTLALTGAAFAAGDTTKKGGDAAQTGSNATGTTTSGASGSGSGQPMKSDSTGSTGTSAPMKGSPNASGAQMKNNASGSGSMGTGSSTTGTGVNRAAQRNRSTSLARSSPLPAGAHFTNRRCGPFPSCQVRPPSWLRQTGVSRAAPASAATGAGTATGPLGVPAITPGMLPRETEVAGR